MAMQLDRSVPPTLSKQPKKRNVAPVGFRPMCTVRTLRPLSNDQIQRITEGLKIAPLKTAYLRRGLQEIAGTLLRQRSQPNPSRSEARAELVELTHKISLLRQETPIDAKLILELRAFIQNMNSDAHNALWGGLDRHPAYPGGDFFRYSFRPDVDWSIIGDAAATGLSLLRRGDYADGAAAIAVEDLITLYQNAFRKRPTFSTRGVGEINSNGRQSQVGNSPCFKFIEAFFAIVDPSTTPQWLTGKMQALLYPRKNRGRCQ